MEKAPQQLELITHYFSDFSEEQVRQFSSLQSLYHEWNEKINVISRKDIESLYERHVLHSLAIAALFSFQDGMEIIDIGTGGGFPGIPLAIFFPNVKFHLVDSIGKKIKVVNEIAQAIELKNITTAHTRAENIHNRKFDFVVSRAVAPLKDLWHWGRPLIRNTRREEFHKNGLICLKGGDLAQEISDSRLRPHIWALDTLFKEEFFKDKFCLYVPYH
jgi:16S rRNA (guanine527-N7)-methyltransferase